MNNHYQILGVAEEATFEEIQVAYEQRAKEYSKLSDSNERMQKVNRAVEVLSNPQARKKLQAELAECRERCRAEVDPGSRKRKRKAQGPNKIARGVAFGVNTLLSTFLMAPRPRGGKK